ncbi:GTPase Era [Deinococcus roseus]|uniref:GTPase Era n=1 Tax=Deinococcus roseus TaxID=392414 RepID=A0ABQ2CZV6_9DEIO|nr:GTPase Era [Deinococcus roseus]GGJ37173.1 GTPase Era [Deinococcus roseus]
MTDAQNTSTHSGFIAIVGKPNVGKSTLLNNMLGVKVAPITNRPQTTRRGIRGILTEDQHQIVFVDTPGMHKAKDALGKYMNEEIQAALSDVDAILWIVDLRHPPTEEDVMVSRTIKDIDKPLIVVGNKLDASKYPEEALRLYGNLLGEREFGTRTLSAQEHPESLLDLRLQLFSLLPENPFFFDEKSRSDQSRENWAAEIIREEAMKRLEEELPYAVATRVTDWEDRPDGIIEIYCDVIVERPGHKAIVIGKGASKLKEIGQGARKQLEVFLNTKIFLKLHVKIMPNWREDPEALRQLGYE